MTGGLSRQNGFPALAKTGCREAAGRFDQPNQFFEQHHPGASRHPSSFEEGKTLFLDFVLLRQQCLVED